MVLNRSLITLPRSSHTMPHLVRFASTLPHLSSSFAMSVFADIELCMTCGKALTSSDAFYCDAVCRANDGAAVGRESAVAAAASANGVPGPRGGKNPSDSPSLLASLPGLLASHINVTSNAAQRQRSSQGASRASTTSSHSESSSPLQSPSPLGHPTTLTGVDASPKEDFFNLPPPAYPNSANPFAHSSAAIGGGAGATAYGSHPVKISSPYAKPSPIPTPASYVEHSTTVMESTLQYGRRPGHTNVVTSPLALLPVGAAARRRESNQNGVGAGRRPRGLSPAAQGRVPSDPIKPAAVEAHRRPLIYGMHSPLLVPASGPSSSRPSSTPAADYAHVNSARPQTTTAASSPGPKPQPTVASRYGSPARPIQPVLPTTSSTAAAATATDPVSSFVARRRSFPVHLLNAERQKFQNSKPQRQPVQADGGGYDADLDLTSPLDNSDEEPPRRGRSRERRETSPAHDSALDSRESRSRDLGIGHRANRSRSRLDGGASDDVGLDHRRAIRHGRSRSRSTGRRHHRNSKELDTIAGSFQGSPLDLEPSVTTLRERASRESPLRDGHRLESEAQRQLKRMFEEGVTAR